MKKIIALLLAYGLVLATVGHALATTKAFSRFTAEVPAGWTAEEDGNVVSLLAPGNAAAISIVVDSADGMSGENLAKAMSTQLKGSAPTAEGQGFTFTFKTPNGVDSKSTLFVNNNQYVMITVTGQHPDVSGILQSIKDK